MTVKDAIKKLSLAGEELYSIQATVKSVDINARTCVVSPVDGSADIRNCLLQGAYGGKRGFVLVPRKDSRVIVTFLSSHQAYIALTSDIEQIQLTGTGESLNKLLIDLIAAIEQLTLSTPAGPSGTPLPPTMQALSNLKQRINNFIIP